MRKLLALFRRKPKSVPVVSQQALSQQERQQLTEGTMRVALDIELAVHALGAIEEVDACRRQLIQADPALQPVLDAMAVNFTRKVADIQRHPFGP